MTGKHYGWHKHWRKDGLLLVHSSGLEIERDAQGWKPVESSLVAFRDSEQSRGVPSHDLPTRLRRLVKEASGWREASNVQGQSSAGLSQEKSATEAQPSTPADGPAKLGC